MSLVICDTNIFISLFKNIGQTANELEIIGSCNVLITSVFVMELYRGMQDKREMAAMQKKITQYNILHFNENESNYALQLINKFKLSYNLQIPDTIIGAMSVVYDIDLLTYNVKGFRFIPRISLYEASC